MIEVEGGGGGGGHESFSFGKCFDLVKVAP